MASGGVLVPLIENARGISGVAIDQHQPVEQALSKLMRWITRSLPFPDQVAVQVLGLAPGCVFQMALKMADEGRELVAGSACAIVGNEQHPARWSASGVPVRDWVVRQRDLSQPAVGVQQEHAGSGPGECW